MDSTPISTEDVPVEVVHTFRNPGRADVRWLTGWNPIGFQRFFVEFGVDVDEPEARRASVADERIQRVIAEADRYDMVMVPDP